MLYSFRKQAGLAAALLSTMSLAGANGGAIDAMVEVGNGKAYIFLKGGQYIRYDIRADRADPGYPKAIDNQTWPDLPWANGIDAALNLGNGKVALFKGSQYVRYDIRADRADPGYPKAIDNQTWPGLPWTTGIDSAVNWGNGKAYFFKGGQYIRYDIATERVDAGYPKAIDNQTWPGLPWIAGIDAAVNWGNGKVTLFKDDQQVRYDVNTDRVDAGYPKPIDHKNWAQLAGAGGGQTPPSPPQSADRFGSTLVVVYPSVCTAIWTRVRTGVYDALTICQGAKNQSFRETLAVESFDGRNAVILRPGYGRYRATLSEDGRTIRGTCDWKDCGPNYRWTGYIDWNWNDAPPMR